MSKDGSNTCARHRADVAFVAGNGCGSRVEHRADAPQSMASSKALNLAAYALAVAFGVLRSDEPVRPDDRERWQIYNPVTTAHGRALDHLGITRVGDQQSVKA